MSSSSSRNAKNRAATRGDGEVIELECGITVYPARSEGGRWRAVWHEGGTMTIPDPGRLEQAASAALSAEFTAEGLAGSAWEGRTGFAAASYS